jgi:uncharacterized DUF497 family protein
LPGPLAFEWNPRKGALNLAKHKVSFEEAVTAFGDPLGQMIDDPRHSVDEERFVLLGRSDRRRLLVVMFTEHGEAIRLISARRATPRERRRHEEGES